MDDVAIAQRRCSRCGTTKPIADFGTYAASWSIRGWWYYSRCRDCARAASREYGRTDRARRNDRMRDWRKQNPEAARRNDDRTRTRYKYGITTAQREDLFAAQGGACAICRRVVKLALDHDHRTGRIRGGLCNRCNVRLGFIEYEADPIAAAHRTAPEHIPAIIRYLGLGLCPVHADGLPAGVDCPDCAPCHGDVLAVLASEVPA